MSFCHLICGYLWTLFPANGYHSIVIYCYSSASVGWRSLQLAGCWPLSPSFCIFHCWNSNLMKMERWRREIREERSVNGWFVLLTLLAYCSNHLLFQSNLQVINPLQFMGISQELQPLPDQKRTNHSNNKLSQHVSICSCLREVQTSFSGKSTSHAYTKSGRNCWTGKMTLETSNMSTKSKHKQVVVWFCMGHTPES